MAPEDLQRALDRIGADFVKRMGLTVEAVEGAGHVLLRMPVTPDTVHAGGVLCGQAIMAAADTAFLLAMIDSVGGFKPMTTVQLQTSFVRPVPGDAGHVIIDAQVLRPGKTLSYGEVRFVTPDGKLAAHATTTYALL